MDKLTGKTSNRQRSRRRWPQVSAGLATLAVLSGCASTSGQPAIVTQSAIERAESETRRNADLYSDFAIARYASLTLDAETALDNYSDIFERAPDTQIAADRAINIALSTAETERAVEIARQINTESSELSDTVRLTLAFDALANQAEAAIPALLAEPWENALQGSIARTMAAWLILPDDPEAAIAQQSNAGESGPVLSRLSATFAAIMKAQTGREDEALADLAELWENYTRTAIGAELEARMHANNGDSAAAIERIKAFYATIGLHTELATLVDEIAAGAVAPVQPLNAREASALFAYSVAAILAEQTSMIDVASLYFALSLHLDPGLDRARIMWADGLLANERYQDAERLLADINAESRYYIRAQSYIADAAESSGDADRALDLLEATILEQRPRSLSLQYAAILGRTAQYGDAERIYTAMIEYDARRQHKDWRAFFARGGIRMEINDWRGAESDLRVAAQLRPNNARIKNELGYGWIERGLNFDEGLSLIAEASSLDPQNSLIMDRLGQAFYQMGDYEQAIIHLENAVAISPSNSDILDHLGDAYWQIGRRLEAGYQWQRAADFAADESAQKPFLEKLENGLEDVMSDRPETEQVG